jgi:hypothetical protein
VRESGGFRLGDGLLDDGVPAVVGFQFDERTLRSVTKAWSSQVVNRVSCEPGVGRTRRTISRTSTASLVPAKQR